MPNLPDDDLGGTFEEIDAIVDEVALEAGVALDATDDELGAVLEMVERSVDSTIGDDAHDDARSVAADDDPFANAQFETTDEALSRIASATSGSAGADGDEPPVDHRDAGPRPAPNAAALRGMDATLAGDVDDLLSGTFDTVSEVLSEVFEEEEITAVGHDGEDVFITADLEELRADDDLLPRLGRRPETDDATGGHSAATNFTVSPTHDDQPAFAEPPPAARTTAPDPPVESLPVVTPNEPAVRDPDAEALEPVLEVVSPRKDVPLPEAGETLPDTGTGDRTDDAGGVPDSVDAEPSSALAERLASVWGLVEPPLVLLLRAMNAPLRHVPQRLRPVVDWIALSLVFWVPVVWIVALFVIGR